MVTGADLIYRALRAMGIEHVFGIVSVHNLPIYDAILRHGGITPIDMRHEQAALHAADAYARVTGKLGVAITSTGPGAANGVPGLFEAGFASSRVMMITGQVETSYYGKGKGVLHEAEKQIEMLRAVTGCVESPRHSNDVVPALLNAGRNVLTGRPQPAAVEIPIDLQYAKVEDRAVIFTAPPAPSASDESLDAAATALADAGKRVIWAGGGAITAGAAAVVQQLAEQLRAPVFTSANGRGVIPEDHELAMGPLTSEPDLASVLADADVVLAVGTRFQAGATANFKLKLGGKLVHIDADAGVINRNYRADVAVLGDAKAALLGIQARLNAAPGSSDYLAASLHARDAARAAIRRQMGPDFQAIMDSMRTLLPRDGNVVRDATVPAFIWGNRLLPILQPNTSVSTTSAAIGPGLPFAIGAAVGGWRKTLLIQGDGGLMLSIGELATAVQYQLPLIVCVFNDGGYGVLRGVQRQRFDGRNTGVDLATPDFVKVAQGMGMLGLRVAGVTSFEKAFAEAVAHEGPVLLDLDMNKLAPMTGLGARR